MTLPGDLYPLCGRGRDETLVGEMHPHYLGEPFRPSFASQIFGITVSATASNG